MFDICLSHKLIPVDKRLSIGPGPILFRSLALLDKLLYWVSWSSGLYEDIIERQEYRVRKDSIFFMIAFLILPNLRLK